MSKTTTLEYYSGKEMGDAQVSVSIFGTGTKNIHIHNVPEETFKKLAGAFHREIKTYDGATWFELSTARDKSQVAFFKAIP